jgi:hypothetical protein
MADDYSVSRADLGRRVWLLLLLDGAERAGVAPVPQTHLHRLVFLANALSPVYELPVEDGKVLKYRRGPFYPDIQWDLDRLAVSGLAQISDIQYIEDEFGWWFTARYGLRDPGIRLVKRVVGQSEMRAAHRFLCELMVCYGDLPQLAQLEAALVDATYSDPEQHIDDVIDFAEWRQRNYSVETTQLFAKSLPPRFELNERDRLHLYVRYLGRMVGRTKVGSGSDG